MKLPLSIFNFKCLRASFMPSVAVIATVFIVFVVNIMVYFQLNSGRLFVSNPFTMVQFAIDDLISSDNAIWFLGNSTLAASIDKKLLQDKWDQPIEFVEFGSATLDVNLKIAGQALKESQSPPKSVFLFFTKDDLNKNGSRANVSKRYMRALEGGNIKDKFSEFFPVYTARFSIIKKIEDYISGGLVSKSLKKEIDVSYRDISQDIDTTYLYNLGQDYEPIAIDLSIIGNIITNKDINIYLVLPPVSKAVDEWQHKYAPDYSLSKLYEDIAQLANLHGIKTLNYSNLLPSSTEYFKDAYHLNKAGSKIFTEEFLMEVPVN